MKMTDEQKHTFREFFNILGEELLAAADDEISFEDFLGDREVPGSAEMAEGLKDKQPLFAATLGFLAWKSAQAMEAADITLATITEGDMPDKAVMPLFYSIARVSFRNIEIRDEGPEASE